MSIEEYRDYIYVRNNILNNRPSELTANVSYRYISYMIGDICIKAIKVHVYLKVEVQSQEM